MRPVYNVTRIKNLLIGAGAYYLSRWLEVPLAFGFGKLTHGITYGGDIGGAVLLPLVMHLPSALVAALSGATVAWIVESDRPVAWAIFPALLYAFLGFLGYHWARPPVALDRVEQTIGALFPALACIGGAMVARGRRATRRGGQIIPS